MRTKTRTLRLPMFIHASPKRVFKWITDSEKVSGWLSDTAVLSARKGGRYVFGWNGGPAHTGKVLRFSRGRELTLSWQWPGKEDLGTTRLRLSVEPKRDGTLLRFTHSGFRRSEEWDELYEGAVRGWTYFMMNLKSVLESDHDLRSPYDW
jgi:uncharacterized protein YndB with AHSA1/START domain